MPELDRTALYRLKGYLKNLQDRLGSLQSTASDNEKQADGLSTRIMTEKQAYARELGEIKEEVDALKQEVGLVKKEVLSMIACLKTSVKADEAERFNKKLELWSPESLVSRREAKRVISQSFA